MVAGTTGALAVGQLGLLSGCAGGARAAPEATTQVPLTQLVPGQRLKIDHHGEPVELLRVGDRVLALSLICTHQYCRMFWHRATNAYRCPCHGGQFSPNGQPLSGPVSQPMWTLPTRITGDVVIVGGVG